MQDSELAKKFEEDARDMYSKAITGLMRDNLLINFAFADFEEVSCDGGLVVKLLLLIVASW